jgi:Ca2+-binding RTX toxin-like protein
VSGVGVWHINADEPVELDYNDDVRDPAEADFERESSALPIYAPDPYRSSDHDPVIVGLDLGGGEPVLSCAGVTGTRAELEAAGYRVHLGTEGNDLIAAFGGRDFVLGLGGRDLIYTNGGDDVICGGDGSDWIYAGSGDDLVDGEGGDDRISGALGRDDLRGGTGDDILWGGLQHDRCDGGPHDRRDIAILCEIVTGVP